MQVGRNNIPLEENPLLRKMYEDANTKANYGALTGSVAGLGTLALLLNQWSQSEAESLRRLSEKGKSIPTRLHPAAAAMGGGLLGILGYKAYQKYKEWKARNQYYV
ncbi:MAG: hypothetical protein WC517_04355 [Patescibacteria group bacterium]